MNGNNHSEQINIPLYLVLTIITCGLFNIYWNYRQMEICNQLIGGEEFSFWPWLFLTFITCGLYHIYYQYKMGMVIVDIQRNKNANVFENLPIISILVTVLGFPMIVDCVHQAELNKFLD